VVGNAAQQRLPGRRQCVAAPAANDMNTGEVECGGDQRAEVLPPALAHAGAGGGERNQPLTDRRGIGLDVAGGLSEEPGDRAHRRGEVMTALRGQRVALLDVADHVRQGCGS
jgi:hypothetical protein